jgi:hypothetical protein
VSVLNTMVLLATTTTTTTCGHTQQLANINGPSQPDQMVTTILGAQLAAAYTKLIHGGQEHSVSECPVGLTPPHVVHVSSTQSVAHSEWLPLGQRSSQGQWLL